MFSLQQPKAIFRAVRPRGSKNSRKASVFCQDFFASVFSGFFLEFGNIYEKKKKAHLQWINFKLFIVVLDNQRMKRFLFSNTRKWQTHALKWYLSPGKDLAADIQAREFKHAFQYWANVTPLRFTQVTNPRDANLKIR